MKCHIVFLFLRPNYWFYPIEVRCDTNVNCRSFTAADSWTKRCHSDYVKNAVCIRMGNLNRATADEKKIDQKLKQLFICSYLSPWQVSLNKTIVSLFKTSKIKIFTYSFKKLTSCTDLRITNGSSIHVVVINAFLVQCGVQRDLLKLVDGWSMCYICTPSSLNKKSFVLFWHCTA